MDNYNITLKTFKQANKIELIALSFINTFEQKNTIYKCEILGPTEKQRFVIEGLYLKCPFGDIIIFVESKLDKDLWRELERRRWECQWIRT